MKPNVRFNVKSILIVVPGFFLASTLLSAPASGGFSLSDLPLVEDPVTDLIDGAPGADDSDRPIRDAAHRELDVRSCEKIPSELRAMVFEHFAALRDYLRAHGGRFDKVDARFFARGLGRAAEESSGDPTCMTTMDSRQIGTYKAQSDLAHWRELFDGSHRMGVATNFGVLQISANRFYVDFDSVLKNETIGFLTDENQNLLGTVEQSKSIFKSWMQLARKEWHEHQSLKKTIRLCGTPFLYKEGKQGAAGMNKLQNAFKSILDASPYDTIKDPKSGESIEKWATKPRHVAAFGKWVTLCPNLGFDLGLVPPAAYFATATRNLTACEDTFKNLLKEGPKPTFEKTAAPTEVAPAPQAKAPEPEKVEPPKTEAPKEDVQAPALASARNPFLKSTDKVGTLLKPFRSTFSSGTN